MERSEARRRMEDALELADLAEQMVVAKLRREHPDATDAEIEARLVAWLHERPGAPDGDAVGDKVALPRGRG